MEPTNDPELTRLLRQWHVPNAPPSLDARVLSPRRKWWSFLISGSIRVPVPVGVAVLAMLLVLTAALVSRRSPAPTGSAVSLVDFRPVDNPNVRVVRGPL